MIYHKASFLLLFFFSCWRHVVTRNNAWTLHPSQTIISIELVLDVMYYPIYSNEILINSFPD